MGDGLRKSLNLVAIAQLALELYRRLTQDPHPPMLTVASADATAVVSRARVSGMNRTIPKRLRERRHCWRRY